MRRPQRREKSARVVKNEGNDIKMSGSNVNAASVFEEYPST